MNPSPNIHIIAQSTGQGLLKLSRTCLLCAVVLTPALLSAQTKKNPPAKAGTEKSTPPKTGSPSTSPIQSDIQASRYISSEELPDYLARLKSVLSMGKRPHDPFGQTQDPNAKPVITQSNKPRRFVPPKPTSFTEIIRRIQVNTIMPGENRFIIGTRSFKKGDRIPIDYRGRLTQVEVTAVNATKIELQNVETGEVANVELNLMPAGMVSSDGKGIHAPGMVVETKDAPLIIESNTP